jgi:hypothetical protein
MRVIFSAPWNGLGGAHGDKSGIYLYMQIDHQKKA